MQSYVCSMTWFFKFPHLWLLRVPMPMQVIYGFAHLPIVTTYYSNREDWKNCWRWKVLQTRDLFWRLRKLVGFCPCIEAIWGTLRSPMHMRPRPGNNISLKFSCSHFPLFLTLGTMSYRTKWTNNHQHTTLKGDAWWTGNTFPLGYNSWANHNG